MVYYGALSKGCERCRKRKVKCDQRKPGCLKCEKSDTQCPGYRALGDVLFRDESARIIRKVHRARQPRPYQVQGSLPALLGSSTKGEGTSASPPPSNYRLSFSLSRPVIHPTNDLGASFFFTKYTFNEPPFGGDFHTWLTQSYCEDGHVLRLAIDAVGTAGISNLSDAPRVESRSRGQYVKALGLLNKALGDPVHALEDETLMAVILLGFYEMVDFDRRDQYQYWAAHIKGSIALLELRGQGKLTQRGAQLYLLIRSQILSICIQQHMVVPEALVKTAYNFHTSGVREHWQQRNIASPASIFEISFRVVNLVSSIKNGRVTDTSNICAAVVEIDDDLRAWRKSLPPKWKYATVDSSTTTAGTSFDSKCHVYPSLWIAETWNGWRILRIFVNQMILQHGDHCSDAAQKASDLIHRLSTDICISTASFADTPRTLSLIRPLYAVLLETSNSRNLRIFAGNQLRGIITSLGIRQASILTDTILKTLEISAGESGVESGDFTVPLIPFT